MAPPKRPPIDDSRSVHIDENEQTSLTEERIEEDQIRTGAFVPPQPTLRQQQPVEDDNPGATAFVRVDGAAPAGKSAPLPPRRGEKQPLAPKKGLQVSI